MVTGDRQSQYSANPGDSHGQEHGEDHAHGHVKISRYAKVLIAMEFINALYAYNFRYLIGVKGSFYTGFQTDTWVYCCNITLFLASLSAVILAVITDSFFQKYTVLVVGFSISMVSPFILFSVSVFDTGQYEKMLNTIGLFWGFLFIVVEPLRVAVFFDQLPNKMDPHTTAHVFLAYQEMKTFGSIAYQIIYLTLGGKVYGKTPLSVALIYFIIPIVYWTVIVAFWKAANPGESTYMIGIDCIMCFVRALHLKFIKRDKMPGHFLDLARDAYDAKTVRNSKIMCANIFLFSTLISYGMASNLQKNSWTDQSQNLIENLAVKKWYLEVNNVFFALTVLLLPFIEDFFLPQIYKRRKDGKPFTELQRIGITVFVTGAAFVSTTILQLKIEKYSSIYPSGSRSQVRIFNVLNDSVDISGNWVFERTNISSTNMIQAWNVKSLSTSLYTIQVQSSGRAKSVNFTSLMATAQGESISYIIGENELLQVRGFDPIVFGPEGTNVLDMVRIYFINYKVYDTDRYRSIMFPGDKVRFEYLGDPHWTIETKAKTVRVPESFNRTVFQLSPGDYRLVCPTQRFGRDVFGACIPNHNMTIKRGGIYAILPLKKETPINDPLCKKDCSVEEHEFKIYTVCNPAYYSIHLMWPQMILQAFAVAMGKIPINVFMFKESPVEARVSTLALYSFSQDGSAIIFAMFSDVFSFRVDSFQLVLVTGIHMVFCFFFTFAALKHQKFPEDDGMRRRRALIGSN